VKLEAGRHLHRVRGFIWNFIETLVQVSPWSADNLIGH